MDVIVTCPSCSQANRLPGARLHEKARCAACKASILPLTHPVTVPSAAEFDDLVANASLPVLVDFWASWCGPCRAVAPELEAIARDKAGHVVVAKVDTDALPDVAGRYSIRSIPTMMLFRGGQQAQRLTGAMPASAITSQLGL